MSTAAATAKSSRIVALDFTKGALVLVMVLYHWLNYFIGPQGEYYRYLRFLPPSFIFITGFLISTVYLSRYKVGDLHVPARLVERGIKILCVFLALNLGRLLLLPGSYAENLPNARDLVAVFVAGNVAIVGGGRAAAFYILVPISYLLIMAGLLLVLSRYCRPIFFLATAAAVLGIAISKWVGAGAGMLELLTIGMLGILCGYIPLQRIEGAVRHPGLLAVSYLLYTVLITVWDTYYPILVVGVGLTLIVIYWIAGIKRSPGLLHSHVVLLGKYSLYAYITQIAILQFLRRGLRHAGFTPQVLILSFLAAFLLTSVSVLIAERARTKAPAVDRLYRAVFA